MIRVLFKEIVLASIIGSILLIFIICMKQLFKKIIDITNSHKLWFLMIVCLLIPFIPVKTTDFIDCNIPKVTRESVNNIVKNMNIMEVVHLAKDIVKVGTNDKEIVPKGKFNFNINVYALIWLGGMIGYFVYMGIINLRIRKMIAESKQDVDIHNSELFHECKLKMGIKREIPIVSVEFIEQPCIYGFFKPVVLFSTNCGDKLSQSQKEYICIHELSHYLRKDHLTNWLLIALKIIYWFNPIIGYAIKRMKEEGELVCDALALSYINYNEHQRYAKTIIDLLDIVSKPRYVLTTVSIISERKTIERRINMIYDFKKSSKFRRVISCFITIVIISVGTTAIYAFNNVEKKMEGTIESNLSNVSNEAVDNDIKKMNFIWPIPDYKTITSPYGLRFHPIDGTGEVDKEVKTTYKECEIGNIKVLEPKIDHDTLNNGMNFHNGIDILAPTDEKIIASERGTIVYCGFDDKYGNLIIIDHGEENYSIYAHCSELLVKEGEVVTKEQEIAKVGSTGQSTGPHLHFSIVIDNKIENPMEYINIENLSTEDKPSTIVR